MPNDQDKDNCDFFGLIYAEFGHVIGSKFQNLNHKSHWLKLYGVILYRVLGHKKDLFKRMFLGVEGFHPLFKPQNFVDLIWKLNLLCLGWQKVRCFHLAGKENTMASRFHFFGMKPNKQLKVFLNDNKEDSCDKDDFQNQELDQKGIFDLATLSGQFTVITAEKRTTSKSFFEALIQKKFKAMMDGTQRSFTLDTLYFEFLRDIETMTMLPPEYEFQRVKFDEMFRADEELFTKYDKMIQKSTNSKKKPDSKRDEKNPILTPNKLFTWWLKHVTVKTYINLHANALKCSDPSFFLKQFERILDNYSVTALRENPELFASLCLKHVSSKNVSFRAVNRSCAGPKLFFKLPFFTIYAQSDWVMREFNRAALHMNNREHEADGTFADSRIFCLKGISLLRKILYQTKLMKVDLKEKENQSFVYDNLRRLETPGIMVSATPKIVST